MDGVIDIVLVVVMIAGFIWKAMKSGVEEPGENFPPIPVPIMEDSEAEEAPKERKTIRAQKIQTVAATTTTTKERVSKRTQLPPKQKNSSVCQLHSPQEARKAFIYSEIFTRKYN